MQKIEHRRKKLEMRYELGDVGLGVIDCSLKIENLKSEIENGKAARRLVQKMAGPSIRQGNSVSSNSGTASQMAWDWGKARKA